MWYLAIMWAVVVYAWRRTWVGEEGDGGWAMVCGAATAVALVCTYAELIK